MKGQWFSKEFITRICVEADDIKQTNLIKLPAVQTTSLWSGYVRWGLDGMLATKRTNKNSSSNLITTFLSHNGNLVCKSTTLSFNVYATNKH